MHHANIMILRPLMRFLRFSTVLAAALSLSLIAACGQKGSLYLRDNPPAGVKVPKPATPKPVPYPADAEKQD
jgi:predicted small lipoprotein YifL